MALVPVSSLAYHGKFLAQPASKISSLAYHGIFPKKVSISSLAYHVSSSAIPNINSGSLFSYFIRENVSVLVRE